MGRASRRKHLKRAGLPDDRRRRNPLQLRKHANVRPGWNSEPCLARRCIVIVADDPDKPEHWAKDVIGEERYAVEVRVPIGSSTFPDLRGIPERVLVLEKGWPHVQFYLDDEPKEARPEEVAHVRKMFDEDKRSAALQPGYFGWGWAKVTLGRGSSRYGHREMLIERVVRYLTDAGTPFPEDYVDEGGDLTEQVEIHTGERKIKLGGKGVRRLLR